jgi:hypothetical protein
MTEPTNSPPDSSAPTSQEFEALAASYGKPMRLLLFILAAALLIYPAYFVVRYRLAAPVAAKADTPKADSAKTPDVPGAKPEKPEAPAAVAAPFSLTFWWLCVLAVGAFATALVNVFYDSSGRMSAGERLRFVLVLLGGILGISTAVYGLALPFVEYSDVFGGGFAEWRKNPGPLFWTALPLLGGLALTFVSLMLTAGLERNSQQARQLLYGYNAVLSALLLLIIFLLLNVFPYSGVWPFRALAQTSDWTSTGLFTLSQSTKERLSSITQPVKVFVILDGNDPYNNFVETMLQTCHEINPKITWETFSRDLNRNQVSDLVNKYSLADPTGLIVVYGTEPNTSFQFIPRKELGSDIGTDENFRFSFKGEAALAGALTYLSEGKTKAVVYFTQGHGELDIAEKGGDRRDASISVLVEALGKSNYEVKPLTFGVDQTTVPDDAAVVVVARPRTKLPDSIVSALRTYAAGDAKKKGKLFVLLGVGAQPDGTMAPTGLEPLLAEYGVQPGNERLIRVDSRDPLDVEGIVNPAGRSTLARAYSPDRGVLQLFSFSDARTVNAQPANPTAPSRYTTEDLVFTLPAPDQYVVRVADLNSPPDVYAAELRKKQNIDRLRREVSARPLPLAVTVAEGEGAPPQIPGHDFMRETQPRMIVFGNAGWISNSEVDARNGRIYRELFINCVNWLRGRPDIGTQPIEAKTRSEYRLPDKAYTTRLLVEPIALILLFVISLGTGIWVVRRR